MLKEDNVYIRVNSKNIEYYNNLGYDIKYGDLTKVLIKHLTHGSHTKIDIQCDSCKNIYHIQYRSINDKEFFTYSCASCKAKERIKKFGTAFSDKNLQKELALRNNKKSFEKRRKTKLIKYGQETYNNQEKKRKTCERKYNNANFNNIEKKKRTCEIKYNDANFNNQEKKRNTCILKYGVEHTNHLPAIFEKIQISALKKKRYKNTNLFYQGSYEYDFLEFCEMYNVIVEIGPCVEYIFDGIKRKYHSDFYIPALNLVIEIKSSYIFNLDTTRNNVKSEAVKNSGYDFIFVIDKNYDTLSELVNNLIT